MLYSDMRRQNDHNMCPKSPRTNLLGMLKVVISLGTSLKNRRATVDLKNGQSSTQSPGGPGAGTGLEGANWIATTAPGDPKTTQAAPQEAPQTTLDDAMSVTA